jgi:hypothetical protein
MLASIKKNYDLLSKSSSILDGAKNVEGHDTDNDVDDLDEDFEPKTKRNRSSK